MAPSAVRVATILVLWLGLCAQIGSARAAGEALLLIEADTGKVLKAENATYPWYPASVTKIMTAYLTLKAVREGRLALNTLLRVSHNAAAQAPTKMGFRPGTRITVDNALKMLMVKSANDVAVVLAEGVSGSVARFADEMNRVSARLGMHQSHWVNPNGLPAESQVTSARDMAILARVILAEFPEYDGYWNIHAIRLGKRVMRNTNSLIYRYPGADGMKTGFICASGFNVVATATRGNRRLIAVLLGAQSPAVRSAKVAHMFESAFRNTGLSWLMPSFGTVEQLRPINAAPPNLRPYVCGKRRPRPAKPVNAQARLGEPGSLSSLLSGMNPPPSNLIGTATINPPIRVYVGRPRPKAKVAARTGRNRASARRGRAAVGLPLPRPRPAEIGPSRRAATGRLRAR